MEQKLALNKKKIFISWSGSSSHLAAIALKEYLPTIIQALDPFVSSEDIEKGVPWFAEIGSQLGQINFGILCITRDNINAPWILFEAGALSKSLDQSRVVPLLIGVSNSELKGPLSQFNTTSINKADMKKLLKTINVRLEDHRITDNQLDKAFELCWPELEIRLTEVLNAGGEPNQSLPTRSQEDILEELLQLTRTVVQTVAGTKRPRTLLPDVPIDMELVRNTRDIILQMVDEGRIRIESEEVFQRLLDTRAVATYGMDLVLRYLEELGCISGQRYINAEALKRDGAMSITNVDSALLSKIGG